MPSRFDDDRWITELGEWSVGRCERCSARTHRGTRHSRQRLVRTPRQDLWGSPISATGGPDGYARRSASGNHCGAV